MPKQVQILDILDQKKIIEFELQELLYGSIEIRKTNNKKYIYTHVKEDGVQLTKYIGEYSELLYDLVARNNIKARELKKKKRELEKKLKELNYIDKDLTKNVSLNIDFAKKHIVDTIYNQAILEGVAITFSDTESIIEGGKVNNLSPEDVLKIINLKHAWDFILNKNVLLSPSDYSLLCIINKFVEEGLYYNAGYLRTTPVKIGGTNWMPDIPIESDIKENINKIINSKKSDIDKAIELLLFVVKKQMFIDGNKRTSIIFANHYLIAKGKGMLVIPYKKVNKYKKLLINYYESNNKKEIFDFIKNECYIKI